MTIKKEKQAKLAWEFLYSNDKESAEDVLGYPIKKSAFNNPNSNFGWDLVGVYPLKIKPDTYNPNKKLYGSDDFCNLQPISFKSLRQMQDLLRGKAINEKNSEVNFEVVTNFFYRTKDFAQNGIYHIWGNNIDYYWYDGHRYAVKNQNIYCIDYYDELNEHYCYPLQKDEFGNWIPKSKCCYLHVVDEEDYSDCIDNLSDWDY